jgi:hypothetical protein
MAKTVSTREPASVTAGDRLGARVVGADSGGTAADCLMIVVITH